MLHSAQQWPWATVRGGDTERVVGGGFGGLEKEEEEEEEEGRGYLTDDV